MADAVKVEFCALYSKQGFVWFACLRGLLYVSASSLEMRDDIISVKRPAVQLSGSASLQCENECGCLYITAQSLF